MKHELILLHGWGFSSNIWSHFIPYLETDFNITALDLLGFGKNTTTVGSSLARMTKNVLENSPKSAIFLGWSLGGLIATNIAIHHPKRITHLINIASTPKFIADNNWPGIQPTLLDKFSGGLKLNYKATLQQFILLQFQGDNIDRRFIRSLQQQIAHENPPSEKTLNDGLAILKNTDLREQLTQIQCPTLYLLGQQDRLVPQTMAKQLKKIAQNSDVDILPKISHAPFLSNPSLCAEKIKKFISC